MNSDLTPDLIQRALPTTTIGRAVEYYAQLGSTNALVRQRARAGQPEGLVVLADEQTAGRGRLGRSWAAPPGSSLLCSVLLRPAWLAPTDAFLLTMLAGVALCDAVEQLAPLHARLKWPNDLLLPTANGLRKTAGVLSELELAGDTIGWAVLGMGINVSWSPQGLVDGRDLATQATSVSAALGSPVERLALLRALLVQLDHGYTALRQGQRSALFEQWRGRLATLGQPVHVHLPAGELRGIAEEVEPSGALRVRDQEGVLHTVVAGDVGS